MFAYPWFIQQDPIFLLQCKNIKIISLHHCRDAQ